MLSRLGISASEWFADVGDCFDGVAFVVDDVEVVVAVVVVVVSKSEAYASPLPSRLPPLIAALRSEPDIDDGASSSKEGEIRRSKGVCLSITPETRGGIGTDDGGVFVT